mmetsp:Transcript_36459/g.84119  ORF Transcript_36459/g.84119 Transcript_36459/m.84119 type:complete len:217 (+) Transcript_36459:591-1241(+)
MRHSHRRGSRGCVVAVPGCRQGRPERALVSATSRYGREHEVFTQPFDRRQVGLWACAPLLDLVLATFVCQVSTQCDLWWTATGEPACRHSLCAGSSPSILSLVPPASEPVFDAAFGQFCEGVCEQSVGRGSRAKAVDLHHSFYRSSFFSRQIGLPVSRGVFMLELDTTTCRDSPRWWCNLHLMHQRLAAAATLGQHSSLLSRPRCAAKCGGREPKM